MTDSTYDVEVGGTTGATLANDAAKQPFLRLGQTVPELGNATSAPASALVFDRNVWKRDFCSPEVYVYRAR